MTTIELVPIDDVKTGRGGKGRKSDGKRYGKYAAATEKLTTFLQENINNSKDGTIRIKIKDIVKEIGPDFVGKSPTSVMWGLKFTLWDNGIVVTQGKHVDGNDLLVFRGRTDKDRLPPSLEKLKSGRPDSESSESEE